MSADYGTVHSQAEFAAFVEKLREDLEAGKPYWQNISLDMFLDGMAYWAKERMPEMYKRNGRDMPPDTVWQDFALLLYMAAVYE